MANGATAQAGQQEIGANLVAMVEAEGSASHPYLKSRELNSDTFAARNLADAAHYLCMLHGQTPGVVDLASEKLADPEVRDWVTTATGGFAAERVFLAHLVAAAGPQPSTPGHGDSDSAILAQRHALETLARSDRRGCGLGAAIALALDWRPIREVLNAAANRLDVRVPPLALPDPGECQSVADALSDGPATERAIRFGCEQALAQHRNLWTLLETRQSVREDW